MTARGQSTRQALLRAALELFSERGFYGTSVPGIAERAGTGAATLYRHFESKEALAEALYLAAHEEFVASVWHDFPPEGPVRRAFGELWGRLTALAKQQPRLIVFLEMHYHAAYLASDVIRSSEARSLERLVALIDEGQRQGVIRRDPPQVLATFVGAAFFGLVKACLQGGKLVNAAALERGEILVWDALRA